MTDRCKSCKIKSICGVPEKVFEINHVIKKEMDTLNEKYEDIAFSMNLQIQVNECPLHKQLELWKRVE